MTDHPTDPRTRSDFEQELADRLAALAAHAPTSPTRPLDVGPVADGPSLLDHDRPALPPPPGGRPRRGLVALAPAAALVVAVAGGLVWLGRSDAPTDTVAAFEPAGEAPPGFGAWNPVAAGPLDTRANAATAWTGSEALFWAGSNLTRGLAFADGAAYDPATDTWRTIPVPGWGHPGMASAFLDGEFWATAKGGAVRYDPATGEAVDLTPPDDLLLAAIVVADGEIHGLGPRDWTADGAAEIGIARYRPDRDRWEEAVFLDAPIGGDGDLYPFLIEWPVLWTGDEVVLWFPDGRGLAHDPRTGTWRELPTLALPDGSVPTVTRAAVAGGRVVVLAATADGGATGAAWLDGDRWRWPDDRLPIGLTDATTVVGAGDWVVAFSPATPPVVLHGPSGTWEVAGSGPRVEAPNTVWTGDRLVVWGGYGPEGGGAAASVWVPSTTG